MHPTPFQSHAQNGEDVVLWRALGHLLTGRYIDIGANDPTIFSISRAFYDQGWTGITVEPVAQYADLHRDQRPRDQLLQVAITDRQADTVVLHEVKDTGLSTLDAAIAERHAGAGFHTTDLTVPTRRLDDILAESGWPHDDIQFMTVDVEGAEAEVVRSIDLTKWRPWVLVIEATAPLSTQQTHGAWESHVLDAGYEFCLFDGISRYYVANEKADELRASLSYPACALDDYTSANERNLAHEAERLRAERDLLKHDRAVAEDELIRWRTEALNNWAEVLAGGGGKVIGADALTLQNEIIAIQHTFSWRVTRPLRVVRRRLRTAAGGRR